MRGQRGQAVVEMALVAPLLVLLLLVAADFGRVFHEYVAVVSAARVAAELAADSSHSSSDEDVKEAARQESDYALSNIGISVAPGGPRTPGTDVTVTVTATFTPLTPIIRDLLGGELQLRSDATARSY